MYIYVYIVEDNKTRMALGYIYMLGVALELAVVVADVLDDGTVATVDEGVAALAMGELVFKLMKLRLAFALMIVLNFFELDAAAAAATDAVVVAVCGLLSTSTGLLLDVGATNFVSTRSHDAVVGFSPVVAVVVLNAGVFRPLSSSAADLRASSNAFTCVRVEV